MRANSTTTANLSYSLYICLEGHLATMSQLMTLKVRSSASVKCQKCYNPRTTTQWEIMKCSSLIASVGSLLYLSMRDRRWISIHPISWAESPHRSSGWRLFNLWHRLLWSWSNRKSSQSEPKAILGQNSDIGGSPSLRLFISTFSQFQSVTTSFALE